MTEEEKVAAMGRYNAFYRNYTTPEEVTQAYGTWAQNGLYDADLKAIAHEGHMMVADLLDELYPSNKNEVYILDVAAGTGRVGQELYSRGFTRIDALDACKPMLEEAKKKNVYEKLINARIGGKPLDIPEGTYDAVSCSAAFVEGHLPAEAIIDLLKLVKTDGFIVMVGGAHYWDNIPEYKDKMAKVMQKLEVEKKMKTAKRDTRDGYYEGKYKAIEFVLQKL